MDIPGIPILGQTTFLVCHAGHVNEAPQHPAVSFKDEDGNVMQAVLCGRCMYEFNASAFGGVLLPKTTSRKEAEWRAKELKEARAKAIESQIREANGERTPSPEKVQ